MSGERMTRREFLAATAAASAAILAGGAARPADQPPGDEAVVVQVRRPASFAGGEAPQDVVSAMVHDALRRLSGQDDLAAAWGAFVRPDDVVGIKINCLFGYGASTSKEVTAAIIAGCVAAGVPPDRIIVWDRSDGDLSKAGYTINRDGPGPRCYGTEAAYEDQPAQSGIFRGRLSTILARDITALINAPILKTHSTAGITMSLKNHYGSFDNPWEYHDNFCDPAIADVNSLPVIREKTRLILADALFPIAEGGPQARPAYTWPYGAILASTDPVAIDRVGLRILNDRRKAVGLAPIREQARHVATAGERGLGVADLARIRLVEVG